MAPLPILGQLELHLEMQWSVKDGHGSAVVRRTFAVPPKRRCVPPRPEHIATRLQSAKHAPAAQLQLSVDLLIFEVSCVCQLYGIHIAARSQSGRSHMAVVGRVHTETHDQMAMILDDGAGRR